MAAAVSGSGCVRDYIRLKLPDGARVREAGSEGVFFYFEVIPFTHPSDFLISEKVRKLYSQAVFRQDVVFLSTHPGLSSQLSNDSIAFQQGTGNAMAVFIQHLLTFVAGLALGLVKGWQLGMAVLSIVPLLVVAVVVATRVGSKAAARKMHS